MFADHLQSRCILCHVLPADVRDSRQVVQLLELLLLNWPANVWPVRESVWPLDIANKCTRYGSVFAWRQAFPFGWRLAN